jgi:hypothetical protein
MAAGWFILALRFTPFGNSTNVLGRDARERSPTLQARQPGSPPRRQNRAARVQGCPKFQTWQNEAEAGAQLGNIGPDSWIPLKRDGTIVPTELNADDKLAVGRLNGLLDYVEALVKLDERPATRLAQHKLADGSQFVLHQHELAGIPGITFDISDSDGPIWLRMDRLQRTTPPQIDEDSRAWIDIPNDPIKRPIIHDTRHIRTAKAEKDCPLEAGEARPDDCIPSMRTDEKDETPGMFFDVMLRLEDRTSLREALHAYCAGPWAEWSEREKPRRRSISIYQRLFEIAQRLSQSGSSESIELIWGIGLARWHRSGESIDIPIVERSIEIEIADQTNATVTIRPRSVSGRVDLRPFEKLATGRLMLAEDAARRCLSSVEAADSEGVSPFRQETFEPILKICGSQLDPEGRYLPSKGAQEASAHPLTVAKEPF